MMLISEHISALLVTGASLLMSLLLLGLWRVSSQPRERFLLLASIAQFVFTLNQIPLFFEASLFSAWSWRATFSAMFGLYIGLTALVVNLLLTPPSRVLLRLTKLYLWLVVPFSFYIFGVSDFTGYLSQAYVQHRLTANQLFALLVNVSLALVVVRRFYVMQHQLLQTRLDADFALERAKLNERQRIMSDIHDTVGSQLVGALSLIRANAAMTVIDEHVSEALQDLRMAVDAIQPVNGNLAAVLATLRHRLQPRLAAAGLQLIWRVDDLPRLEDLTPAKIQHIQRIVMEAFSNVIQYAKASKVTVTALYIDVEDCIQFSIADDGVGLVLLKNGTGHGLANIKVRADALGAAFDIASDPVKGTNVTLTLPLRSSPNS
jgi:signal transduction histidine kinase